MGNRQTWEWGLARVKYRKVTAQHTGAHPVRVKPRAFALWLNRECFAGWTYFYDVKFRLHMAATQAVVRHVFSNKRGVQVEWTAS